MADPRRAPLARRISAEELEKTAIHLRDQIELDLPHSGLCDLAEQLVEDTSQVAEVAETQAGLVHRTKWISYILISVLTAVVIAASVLAFRSSLQRTAFDKVDWLGLADTLVSDLIFAFLAMGFLLQLPDRLHRGQLLRTLHDLRQLAHLVDLHQLTKHLQREGRDVSNLSAVSAGSHALDISTQLRPYLEYCSEILSLVGKVGSLCSETSGDPNVMTAVNDLENLTSAMSRKIWQKIAALPVT